VKSSLCCSFLVDYLEGSLKLILELLIVVEYEFLIVYSFLQCLVKKLVQFAVNSIKRCILEVQYSKQFFVHLKPELCLVEFDIQLKLDQEGLQLLSLVCEHIECQYLEYIDHLLKALKIDLTCQS